ncbi:App1 family protein [uncultured Nocardioides sp.]|uniref:App1 family protein n=1 Tax=uncultured Nocardioides sp. TaxID=198441 RepID=UPI0025DBDE0F|nr:phosphatase domain-containing protein [uncultured Nocardioides sp.]
MAPRPEPPHVAARAEARMQAVLGPRLRDRGWRPTVVPVVAYGAPGWARVMCRVLLRPPGTPGEQVRDGRGWRHFLTAKATGTAITVRLGDRLIDLVTGTGGYVDARLDCDLPPGWHTARLQAEGGEAVEVPVRIVAPGPGLGLLSDIDDTVLVTMLPRPVVALRNAFLLRESARQPVPGMAALYREVLEAEPDAFVVYLSTGAWNTAGALTAFLRRHDYPVGPLLLTDWGPTQTGWFRSGQEHKRAQLRRLLEELPQLRWLLVGDDGQHDPSLYAEVAAAQPDRVLGVAIRQLSATEQVATHGTPGPKDPGVLSEAAVLAPDGQGLGRLLRERGIVLGPRA